MLFDKVAKILQWGKVFQQLEQDIHTQGDKSSHKKDIDIKYIKNRMCRMGSRDKGIDRNQIMWGFRDYMKAFEIYPRDASLDLTSENISIVSILWPLTSMNSETANNLTFRAYQPI